MATTALLATVGCSDLFDVDNPGRIQDEDLNIQLAMRGLVTGMSGDYSAHLDELAFMVARASDEMTGSGSYGDTGNLRRGILLFDEVNGYWERGHRARWVAENGLERMEEVMGESFASSPLTARANLFAGLANRTLGETVCYAVFDGGPAEDRSLHFDRALPYLTEAIAAGERAGTDSIVTAAYGVRAQTKAALGDWAGAVADAAQVPTEFVYYAIFSDNSGREQNVIFTETNVRPEMSAFGVLPGSLEEQDPRTPWTDCRPEGACQYQQGADGATPHFRQEKFPDRGADIPVVKGTEMRLIEAEAALLQGNVAGAMDKINVVRAFWNLDPLSASNAEQAWTHLKNERLLTLWLEGRRLWDLERWDDEFIYGGGNVYQGIERRDTCIPIPQNECQTNPNVTGQCEG